MNSSAEQPVSFPTINQRQFRVLGAAGGLFAVVMLLIYLQEGNKEWRLRDEQSHYRLDLAQEIFTRDLERVRADLLFVAALPDIKFANAADQESLRTTAAIFCDFVVKQKTYSQIRLIDRMGMEVVRVNWNGKEAIVTAATELQNKSDRYYVSDSLSLKPGEIFTSEFDLNLENGKIEKPLNPVIRFVTPVPDNGIISERNSRDGKSEEGVSKVGEENYEKRNVGERNSGNLLVFNYQGSTLLDELSSISLPGKTYLIRSDGQFLLGPDASFEWGWILGHSHRFQTCFDEVEPTGIANDQFILASNGCFAAREIGLESNAKNSVEARQSLFFVSHIPRLEAFASTRILFYRMLILGGVMLIPVGLVTRLWAAAMDRREDQNKKIAQSEKQLRQLSARLVHLQEEERRSISREIHDSLGQMATAINLDLRMLKDKLDGRRSPDLDRVINESDELLRQIHGFATRVRPAELDDLGLKDALESHIWDFEVRTGVNAKLDWKLQQQEIDGTISENLFRLVQESLNNIAKHANARVATVCLTQTESADGSFLELVVEDDGIGIKVPSDEISDQGSVERKSRLGMLGIKERVGLLGGRMQLISREDRGTCLTVQIPMKPEGDQ